MRKPRYDDILEVEITSLTPRGEGRATVVMEVAGKPRRYKVVVRRALPGDVIRARVNKLRRHVISASLDEIITPAAERTAPKCGHFGEVGQRLFCGGCTLQTLGYPQQLEAKTALIAQHLREHDRDVTLLRDAIPMESPWFYRNKMELTFGTDATTQEVTLGMHPPGFKYEVFKMTECYLMSEESVAITVAIGEWAAKSGLSPFVRMDQPSFLRTLTIREGKRTGDRLVELTTTGDEAPGFDPQSFLDALDATGVPISSIWWTRQHTKKGETTRFEETLLRGADHLREELHVAGQRPLNFQIHPRAFFQPNTRGAELLYGVIAEAANVPGGARVLDLYCGTGTIGLCLAERAAHVTGIELQPDAVASARANALNNGVENVTFHAGDVSKVLAGLSEEERKADVVIVDPPRSGLVGGAIAHLHAIAAKTLVVVSCNPASLARDLVALQDGGYTPHWIQPVDMFPQTAHIENVCLLTR